jgi:hypothetical protein
MPAGIEVGFDLMTPIRLIALGLCVAVLAFAGATARHEPGAPHANLQKELEGKGSHSQKDNQPVTAEEWVQIEAWMKVNCPNRLAFMSRMGDAQGQKEQAKLLIAGRFRQIQRSKDKGVQNALIQEAQAQDLIFGAQLKLREARREREKPQREQAKAEIRLAVGRLIDAQAERFQAESEHLRKNKPALIEEWSRGMIKSAGGPASGETPDPSEPKSGSPGETGSSGSP